MSKFTNHPFFINFVFLQLAGSLPTYGKRFVIINKQVTPYDSKAALILKADVDTVFSRLMSALDK